MSVTVSFVYLGNPMKSKKINVKSEIEKAKSIIKDVEKDEDLDDSLEGKDPRTNQKTPNTLKPSTNTELSQNKNVSTSRSAKLESTQSKAVPTSKASTSSKGSQINKRVKDGEHTSNTAPTTETTQTTKPSARESIAKLEVSNKLDIAGSVNSSTTNILPDSKKAPDVISVSSRISVITEESETGDDFYEQIMAKYGIELSDDDD